MYDIILFSESIIGWTKNGIKVIPNLSNYPEKRQINAFHSFSLRILIQMKQKLYCLKSLSYYV